MSAPADLDIMTHSSVLLRPDPSRTVVRPFAPEDPSAFVVDGHPRPRRIVERVLSLDAEQLAEELERMVASLSERHREVEDVLIRRCAEVLERIDDRDVIDRDRQLLIGAYFSEEYSYEAAALFNPSMVLHWDQTGMPQGAVRFVISLRGIGEGHVSSVAFRTGIWSTDGTVVIDAPGAQAVAPRIEADPGDPMSAIVRLNCAGSRDVSETVIFPMTPSQRQGIEDLRLVRFAEDDGTISYLGTYTAFSGADVRQEMLHATDFRNFEMRAVNGAIAGAKGMALFPRRIDGRYAALTRQDNENIWLTTSDDLYDWGNGERLITPRYPWEFVQMGNCGSPIEIDEGWLVLTHGVGMVRNYCVGACLLDKQDPSKVLGRTPRPLLTPSPKERDGYVPNVVYSCGALVHERTLLLPYGVADNFTTFATGSLDAVLGAMI